LSNQIEEICNALEEIASFTRKSWNDDRTLREVYGWHHPAITRHDLADIAVDLLDQIKKINIETIDSNKLARLADTPRRLSLLKTDTIPLMFNGNGHQAVPAYLETINWIRTLLGTHPDWQTLQDNKAMPYQLAKRLRGIQADIEELVPNKETLEEQVKLIQEATETAESLPADLQSLKEARATVNRLSTESAEHFGKITDRSTEAGKILSEILKQKNEAEKLVLQCEEAYRITTTKGLAAAFDQRAIRLSWSMWIWVIGLLAALGIGANLGTKRIELLSAAITLTDPQWGVILMHMLLSLLSVAAPLWFAWLATKQIGQRFRLAEDYGFKASVAKAYEGYRKEAARIDSAFEARLFASTLSRLEEAPLRLVEDITHGSPWHELISSKGFQKAIDTVPELKETFIDISKKGLDKINIPRKNTSKKPSETE